MSSSYMTYETFVQDLANIMAMDPTVPDFQNMVTQAIQYAEKRIYRELDILDTVWVSETNFTPNDRVIITPPAAYGNFITVQGINVLYGIPVQRQVLQPVSVTFLNTVWGSPTTTALPQYFSMFRQDTMIVGPWPDQDYVVEVYGTFRPQALSNENERTSLTTYWPDLFLAAACVYGFGWMRDYGGQSDNPQSAQSWEAQYQSLMKGAELENLRAKFAGPGWTSLSSIPVADSR